MIPQEADQTHIEYGFPVMHYGFSNLSSRDEQPQSVELFKGRYIYWKPKEFAIFL